MVPPATGGAGAAGALGVGRAGSFGEPGGGADEPPPAAAGAFGAAAWAAGAADAALFPAGAADDEAAGNDEATAAADDADPAAGAAADVSGVAAAAGPVVGSDDGAWELPELLPALDPASVLAAEFCLLPPESDPHAPATNPMTSRSPNPRRSKAFRATVPCPAIPTSPSSSMIAVNREGVNWGETVS
jgi:hypothetical protein